MLLPSFFLYFFQGSYTKWHLSVNSLHLYRKENQIYVLPFMSHKKRKCIIGLRFLGLETGCSFFFFYFYYHDGFFTYLETGTYLQFWAWGLKTISASYSIFFYIWDYPHPLCQELVISKDDWIYQATGSHWRKCYELFDKLGQIKGKKKVAECCRNSWVIFLWLFTQLHFAL